MGTMGVVEPAQIFVVQTATRIGAFAEIHAFPTALVCVAEMTDAEVLVRRTAKEDPAAIVYPALVYLGAWCIAKMILTAGVPNVANITDVLT